MLGICILSMACSHEHDAHHQDTSEHNHANSSAGADAELSLNAGKPWEADASTNQGMRKLNARLEHAEPETPAGYRQLQQQLQSDVNTIIAHCQMEGPAHAQLHIYLGMMQSEIDALDSPKSHQAQQALLKLRNLSAEYDSYFQ
ncbi:MAG: hypothetical protein KDK30_17365 [Leptospiraceae bacterium]|nr:hypothetical protein [Leptospiraceae bacterium]MCB1321992.1 hypothetical protein [Leptospiraceae bacterium]